jgi:hypothetical protein
MPCCASRMLPGRTAHVLHIDPLAMSRALAVDQVPAVALEPRITFFRGLPKVGAYVAAAVPADGTDPSQVSGQVLVTTSTWTGVCAKLWRA